MSTHKKNRHSLAVDRVAQCVQQNVSYHLIILVSIKHQFIIFLLLEGAGIKTINLFFRVVFIKDGEQGLTGFIIINKDFQMPLK